MVVADVVDEVLLIGCEFLDFVFYFWFLKHLFLYICLFHRKALGLI